MTIFNTVQFPAFDGVSKVTQPAAPQLSLPGDEAIQIFQQAYERPSESPQTVERPAELPKATPETLAKVVEENLTLAKELPQPQGSGPAISAGGEEPRPTRPASAGSQADRLASVREAGRLWRETLTPVAAASVAVERPAELPRATPETLAKVVEENLALAKELPQPVELPAWPTVPVPDRRAANDTDSVPQALPETVAGVVPSVAPTVNALEAASVAGVAAKVSAEAPRTASSVVIEAASAVADTLLVTSNMMHGGGEIRVQLKPDVLDGAQICIKVMGKSMQVEFEPVTDDVARLLTESQARLVQHLAERMPTFEFAVTVLPGNMTGRRLARKAVEPAGGEA